MSTFSNDICSNQLGIELDKETYTSGEQVNGVIYTNLSNPPDGSQIVLKIKGKETISFYRKVKTPLPKAKLKLRPYDGSE